MHTHKRILSGLLALCMILALCPVIPFTAKAADATTPIKLSTIGKTGSLAGMNSEAIDITYLSDLHNQTSSLTLNDRVVDIGNNTKIVLNGEYSSNLMPFVNGSRYSIYKHANTDANGYRTFTVNGQSVSYHYTEVALGYTGIKYTKALGVHPAAGSAADRYIVYNVKDLGDHFYAVVGGTGGNINNPKVETHYVDFEVWGSTSDTYDADSFVQLAYVQKVRSYLTAEFDIDITGYNYIKLVYKLTSGYTDASNAACAWGNACVYTVPVPETEPPTELPSNPPHSTDPRDPSYYAGKKVSILGDSISTYTNVSNNPAYNTTIDVNKGFYGDGSYGGFTRKDTWWQQTSTCWVWNCWLTMPGAVLAF